MHTYSSPPACIPNQIKELCRQFNSVCMVPGAGLPPPIIRALQFLFLSLRLHLSQPDQIAHAISLAIPIDSLENEYTV